MPDTVQDTASSSAEQPQLTIPFTAAAAGTDDDDNDLFGPAAAVPSGNANLGTIHHASAKPQDPEIMQDHPGRPENGLGAMQQDSSMAQGLTTAELTQQVSLLQQQLHESQQHSRQLQSALDSLGASRASEQQQHKQQLQSAKQQQQQQLQQASQHQAEVAGEKKRANGLQQRLHSSEQQAQNLQQQLSQQLKGAQEAEAESAVLKEKLKQAQRQLLAAEDELASYQQEADSQMSHQLHEQQQALLESKKALQFAQAEIQERNADLSSSQAELQSTTAELQASKDRVLKTQQQAVVSQHTCCCPVAPMQCPHSSLTPLLHLRLLDESP